MHVCSPASSAYDDTPWIVGLAAYLARVVVEAPTLRIVGASPHTSLSFRLSLILPAGICFGQQILARALGGACVPNNCWEVGPTRVQLTPLGERVFGPSEGVSEEGEIVSCFLSALSFHVFSLLLRPAL